MKLGIICPSEIALRRFMPALQNVDEIEFVGLGACTVEERFGRNLPDSDTVKRIMNEEHAKAEAFIRQYGGKIFDGYAAVTDSEEIDAVYIPLPPALHFVWAKRALEHGKHVLVEKPSTISSSQTRQLAALAEKNGLALHENYMFAFHNQLKAIEEVVESGELGDVRLYRINFGFPKREANDFRYNKALGGGALIDAGGYTLKYAAMLLGETAHISYATMNYLKDFEVDMYGSGAMLNEKKQVAWFAFGMDNSYKCELEIWGSRGCLRTGRILTAPAGFVPEMVIQKGNTEEVRKLPADDAFAKSIRHFLDCVHNSKIREQTYLSVQEQAELVDEFRRKACIEK